MIKITKYFRNRNLIGRISHALKNNMVPGIILWLMGLSLVGIYYLSEFSRPWFDKVIQMKEIYGYAYSSISTCIFGGLIPFVFMRLSGRERKGSSMVHGSIFLLYWAMRGVDVDAFYRFQDLIFGNAVDFKTIAAKVLIDQFLYCVFWASPITAFFYTWKEANFSLTKWKGEKTWQELFDLIIVFMVSTWLVWIPGTAIIYSLPYPLQIPLFNLTLCFFVILVSVFSKKEERTEGN